MNVEIAIIFSIFFGATFGAGWLACWAFVLKGWIVQPIMSMNIRIDAAALINLLRAQGYEVKPMLSANG